MKTKMIVKMSASLLVVFSLIQPAIGANWTSRGPYGGNAAHLTMAGTNPDIMYAGTESGVFKSVNGGRNWTSAGLSGNKILTLQAAPSTEEIIYAGTENGIYKSEDGGTHWAQKNGSPDKLSGAEINTIAIDPNDPSTILVGTGGTIYVGVEEIIGVFKSTNGGENWQQTLAETNGIYSVLTLLVDTVDPTYIYAGCDPNNTYLYGNANGFFVSSDRGETWVSRHIGYDTWNSETVATLAMSYGVNPPTLYALAGGLESGIYKSADRGMNWTPSPIYETSFPTGILAVDFNDPLIIYYVGNHGVLKTADGGTTWISKENGLPSVNFWDIEIDPRNSNAYLGLQYYGVYKTVNQAESWSESTQGLNATYIEDLTTHPSSSDTAFVIIDGGGGDPNLLKTTNGGNAWEYMPNAPTNLGAIEVDPQTPSVIWAGDGMHSDWDFYVYKTTNSGTSWIDKQVFSFSSAANFSAFSDILIHPEDSNAILVASKNLLSGGSIYGGGVLARSLDGGNAWNFLIGLSTICIAMDPNDHQVVYAGRRRSGQVFKFTNVWGEYVRTEITPDEGIGDVHAIEVDLNSRVYVAASDGLWRWDGTYWIKYGGLPDDEMTALAIDRSIGPGVIYVGTLGHGIFVSQNGGNTWTSFNQGLENLYITKLAISSTLPKILHAGTAYGGVWSRNLLEVIKENEDVIIDFGDPYGLFVRYNDSSWKKLHPKSPEQVVAGDMDGTGLDDVIIDFGASGIWVRMNDSSWTKLHPSSGELIATGDMDGNGQDEVIIDFGASGTWVRMNNSYWTRLHLASPERIAIADLDGTGQDDAIIDFGSSGIWVWMNNASWTKLHSSNPDTITTGDIDNNGKDDVIIDFGSSGIWVWMNNASWSKLHPSNPDGIYTGDMDGNGLDEVIIDFGSSGIWVRMNDSSWSKLHPSNPDSIATGDMDGSGQDDVIIDFGSSGLWARYNNASWTKLHSANCEAMATGNIDGN